MGQFPGHKTGSARSEYRANRVRNWPQLKLIRKAPHSDGRRRQGLFASQP